MNGKTFSNKQNTTKRDSATVVTKPLKGSCDELKINGLNQQDTIRKLLQKIWKSKQKSNLNTQ